MSNKEIFTCAIAIFVMEILFGLFLAHRNGFDVSLVDFFVSVFVGVAVWGYLMVIVLLLALVSRV